MKPRRHRFRIRRYILQLLLATLWLCSGNVQAQTDYVPVPGLIDLRTTFSDGAYDPEGLAQLARSRGLGVLVITDHDRVAMEYGLPPFRKILKKTVEHNSILLQGAGKYLHSLKEVERRHHDIIIVPGSETTPFYFWSGNLLKGSLTANNPERRLLTIGLDHPEDYENLPILHNSGSPKDDGDILPGIAMLFVTFLLSLLMIRWKGVFRIAGIGMILLSTTFMVNHLAASGTSLYDPYHGDQGIAPYQLVIDYVNSKGGLTFWNYPETKSGIRKLGPIWVNTPPYPQVLEESRGYTGFSSLYGETIGLTEPGNIWDLTLKEYCRGLRDRPPWGIATADFHSEGESGEKLGNYQTVFFLREKTKVAVLDALKKGRMYAAHGAFPKVPTLLDFSVTSRDGDQRAVSGEEVLLKGKPTIKISLSAVEAVTPPARIRIIRSGQLVKMLESNLPVEIRFEDDYFKAGEKTYYRMDMRGAGIIVSNPIFVRFETEDRKE
jgi:hypothetical protein